MKTKLNTSLLFSLAAIIASCSGNFFDAEIELPIPEHDPVLAISCFINNSDEEQIAASVSRTYGLFEDSPADNRIFDATIDLYEDGSLLYSFDPVDLGEANYAQDLTAEFGGEGKNV